MKLICCLGTVTILSIIFSSYIKKYKHTFYILATVISLMAIYHASLILNGYSIKYIPVLRQFMNAIDSGALGGSLFILVMYIGALNNKFSITKKLKLNRAEISIIACIMTVPHNVHYFFAFVFNAKTIIQGQGFPLYSSLMMFATGLIAIIIMIPLFITSFMYLRRKMKASSWKWLQEYAYIFYAMIYIQVMMYYLSIPNSLDKTLSLCMYTIIFFSYTALRIYKLYEKRKLVFSKSI